MRKGFLTFLRKIFFFIRQVTRIIHDDVPLNRGVIATFFLNRVTSDDGEVLYVVNKLGMRLLRFLTAFSTSICLRMWVCAWANDREISKKEKFNWPFDGSNFVLKDGVLRDGRKGEGKSSRKTKKTRSLRVSWPLLK